MWASALGCSNPADRSDVSVAVVLIAETPRIGSAPSPLLGVEVVLEDALVNCGAPPHLHEHFGDQRVRRIVRREGMIDDFLGGSQHRPLAPLPGQLIDERQFIGGVRRPSARTCTL